MALILKAEEGYFPFKNIKLHMDIDMGEGSSV